jgi:hypothetical protein
MVHHILVGGCLFQGGMIVEIPIHHSEPVPSEQRCLLGRAGKGSHLHPGSPERLHQVAPDEPGGTSHQRLHILRSYSR